MDNTKKNRIFIPNAIFEIKKMVGVLIILFGFLVVILVWLFLILTSIAIFSENYQAFENLLGFLNSLKIDTGLSIIIGSTIISGAILLIGINKTSKTEQIE
jgi:hypothetical protein